VAGISDSLQAGIEKAAAVIDSGAALEKLNQLIERSNRV
jgi:anthranilate phosphoribosyltransferase